MKKANLLLAATAFTMIVVLWYLAQAPEPAAPGAGRTLVEVTLPDLSPAALAGKAVFDDNCASCHGQNAAGIDGAGPPLIHKIYEPSHHGDMAFVLAVRQGVRQHHWSFGDMQPVEGVSEDQIAAIVAYVRELQRANGIR